ncbi:hypothetical protein [Streptomyces sp. NPDC001380]|uniref:SCO4983 family protein n=1 Tax=Streptomyces sp. NPDC001380 TaxID=3364566 RepID=UPI0036854234
MYEPIRHRSVHTLREPAPAHPHAVRHNSSDRVPAPSARPAHLRQQLARHLGALLDATTDLRRATDAAGGAADPALAAHRADLDDAARRIAARIAELAPAGGPPPGGRPSPAPAPAGRGLAALHARAHALAGRVLVVAAAQQDTATAMLACLRMDAHDAARRAPGTAPAA